MHRFHIIASRITGIITAVILVFALNGKAQNAALKVQLGHQKAISALAVTNDGKLGVTGGLDNAVKLWNLTTGKLIRSYQGHRNFVKAVAFHQDEKSFASGSWDGTLRLYHVHDKQAYLSIEAHQRGVEALVFKKAVVATASLDGMVRIWKASSGNLLQELKHEKPVHALAMQQNGSFIAAGLEDGSVILWDASSGERLQTWKEHNKAIKALAFHPDNQLLASTAGDKQVKLWKIDKKRSLSTMRNLLDLKNNYSGFHDIAFNGSGSQLAASCTSNEIITWGIPGGKRLKRINTRQFPTEKLHLSVHGDYAWVSSGRKLMRWELGTGTLAGQVQADALNIRALAVDKSGNRLAIGTDRGLVRLLDLQTGRELGSFFMKNKQVEALHFIPDSQQVFAALRNGSMVFYNFQTDSIARQIKNMGQPVGGADFRVDGKYFGLAGPGNRVLFMDARNGRKMRSFNGHRGRVLEVSLSANGNWLASASRDGSLRIWDVHANNLKQRFNLFENEWWSSLFLGDNTHLAGGGEHGNVHILRVGTEEPVRTWKAHNDIVEALAVSPNGQILATGGWDHQIHLWNWKTGQKIASFTGHQNYVKALSFSPDGNYLISGGAGGQVKIWNVTEKRELLAYIPSENKQRDVVLHPAGYFDGDEMAVRQRLHYTNGLATIGLGAYSENYHYPQLWALIMKHRFNPAQNKPGEWINPPSVEIRLADKAIERTGYMQYATDKPSVEVEVVVKQTDGDVQEVRLFHNGKLVGQRTRGFKRVEEEKAVIKRRFRISLPEGRNKLQASAIDANRGEALSETLSIKRKGAPKKPDLHILAIGINAYKNSSLNLNYARDDAEAFISQTQEGAEELFGEVHVHYLKDQDFVKSSLEAAIASISGKAAPRDVFVFYYAGHGTLAGKGKAEDFYLVPWDVTQLYGNVKGLQEYAVSTSSLREYVRNIPARKQLLILDACHSGQAIKTYSMRGAAEQKALVQLARSSGLTMIASSSSQQYATEVEALGHGVFTYAFLEALKGKADGGLQDKKITVNEIRAYLNDRVPQLTQKHKGQAQFPVSFSRGQDFPVVIAN